MKGDGNQAARPGNSPGSGVACPADLAGVVRADGQAAPLEGVGSALDGSIALARIPQEAPPRPDLHRRHRAERVVGWFGRSSSCRSGRGGGRVSSGLRARVKARRPCGAAGDGGTAGSEAAIGRAAPFGKAWPPSVSLARRFRQGYWRTIKASAPPMAPAGAASGARRVRHNHRMHRSRQHGFAPFPSLPGRWRARGRLLRLVGQQSPCRRARRAGNRQRPRHAATVEKGLCARLGRVVDARNHAFRLARGAKALMFPFTPILGGAMRREPVLRSRDNLRGPGATQRPRSLARGNPRRVTHSRPTPRGHVTGLLR